MTRIIKNNFGNFLVILVIFSLVTGWIFSGWPQIWQKPPIPPEIKDARATNYLTNPSFTGGTTGWTLSVSEYDSVYYQDSAGSAKTATAVGRNKTATGYAEQTIGTNINSADTVLLSHYWSKQCVTLTCAINTIQVDIAKPSAPTTWVTIWQDTTTPAAGSATSWTGPSGLDVSSYFDETGEYKFRVYANLKSENNTAAQALAWFDNITLDVTGVTISITRTVGDGVISYGYVALNGTKNTGPGDLNDVETYRNNGSVAELFRVKTSTATGGATPWTVGATIGTDVFVHNFATTTGLTWQILDVADTYETASSSVAVNATLDLYLKINAPSGTTVYDTKTITINIQAIQAP